MISDQREPKKSYKHVACTIYEKVCPVCGNVVEVEPLMNWEAELHFVRDWRGHSVRCAGTGQPIPQGEPRTRIVVRLQGNKT